MNIHQLKEYLKCAIDLESAKLTCEEAVNAVQKAEKRIRSINQVPVYPTKPEYKFLASVPRCDSIFVRIGIGIVPISVISILLFIAYIYFGKQNVSGSSEVWNVLYKATDYIEDVIAGMTGDRNSLVYALIDASVHILIIFLTVLFLFAIVVSVWESESFRKKTYRYEKEKKKAEADYQNRLSEWTEITKNIEEKYSNICRLRDQECDMISKAYRQYKNEAEKINNKLIKHYENGPIYIDFQNFVAVTQIYVYIASGIADELEGPNGAYAQYMNDVRTARVCDNLVQIRDDMQKGFEMISHNQMMLYKELQSGSQAIRQLNETMTNIGCNIDNKMKDLLNASSNIANNINDLHYDVNALNKEISTISEKTNETAYNTAKISLNQFLDMKSRGVYNYYSTFFN